MNISHISGSASVNFYSALRNAVRGTRDRLSKAVHDMNKGFIGRKCSFSYEEYSKIFNEYGFSLRNNKDRFYEFFLYAIFDYCEKYSNLNDSLECHHDPFDNETKEFVKKSDFEERIKHCLRMDINDNEMVNGVYKKHTINIIRKYKNGGKYADIKSVNFSVDRLLVPHGNPITDSIIKLFDSVDRKDVNYIDMGNIVGLWRNQSVVLSDSDKFDKMDIKEERIKCVKEEDIFPHVIGKIINLREMGGLMDALKKIVDKKDAGSKLYTINESDNILARIDEAINSSIESTLIRHFGVPTVDELMKENKNNIRMVTKVVDITEYAIQKAPIPSQIGSIIKESALCALTLLKNAIEKIPGIYQGHMRFSRGIVQAKSMAGKIKDEKVRKLINKCIDYFSHHSVVIDQAPTIRVTYGKKVYSTLSAAVNHFFDLADNSTDGKKVTSKDLPYVAAILFLCANSVSRINPVKFSDIIAFMASIRYSALLKEKKNSYYENNEADEEYVEKTDATSFIIYKKAMVECYRGIGLFFFPTRSTIEEKSDESAVLPKKK